MRKREMNGKRKRSQHRKATPKLRVPYYQQIWWDALNDLHDQLATHGLTSKPDKLQFQTGRLFGNLERRIEAAGKKRSNDTMFLCYSFVTDCSLRLGYDEPRRLHFEEMKALAAIPSVERLSWVPKHKLRKLGDCELLLSLLDSIASWVKRKPHNKRLLRFHPARSSFCREKNKSGKPASCGVC